MLSGGYRFTICLSVNSSKGSMIEEALPQGSGVGWRSCGWGGRRWMPSVGCFVNHCRFESMWESLSDSPIVLVAYLNDDTQH